MSELLRRLKLENIEPQDNMNGSYTIDIDSSNMYQKILLRLFNDDEFEEDDEASDGGKGDSINIQFIGLGFIITMIGDFEENIYRMVIRPQRELD